MLYSYYKDTEDKWFKFYRSVSNRSGSAINIETNLQREGAEFYTIWYVNLVAYEENFIPIYRNFMLLDENYVI